MQHGAVPWGRAPRRAKGERCDECCSLQIVAGGPMKVSVRWTPFQDLLPGPLASRFNSMPIPVSAKT